MSNEGKVRALAARLRAAEVACEVVEPIRGEIGFDDLATAYAVQQATVDVRVAAGERIVGRKVGLTSPAVQTQIGVAQPDFGTLFATMAYGDKQSMSLAKLIQPRIEAEIALVLKHDLTQNRHIYPDVINATDYALAAIEVVDSRVRGWDIQFVDTVADNASSAMFVLGSRPVPLASLDLSTCAMTVDKEGELLSQGNGSACLGNPLNAALWLADRMVELGTPLRAGDVLLTGALGPMVAVTRPGTYTATIEGIGSVRAVFT